VRERGGNGRVIASYRKVLTRAGSGDRRSGCWEKKQRVYTWTKEGPILDKSIRDTPSRWGKLGGGAKRPVKEKIQMEKGGKFSLDQGGCFQTNFASWAVIRWGNSFLEEEEDIGGERVRRRDLRPRGQESQKLPVFIPRVIPGIRARDRSGSAVSVCPLAEPPDTETARKNRGKGEGTRRAFQTAEGGRRSGWGASMRWCIGVFEREKSDRGRPGYFFKVQCLMGNTTAYRRIHRGV